MSVYRCRCSSPVRVNVLGLDIDPAKIDAINSGRTYIKHIEPAAIQEQTKSGRFTASTDFSRIRDVEAVIICVPTPLNKNRSRTSRLWSIPGGPSHPNVHPGMLVALESSTYPGTTDTDLRAVLERDRSCRREGFSPRVFA